MVTELPLYVWVPTISFSPLTDSFKYVCLWFMIVSKQALSYIENKRCCFATQSVHRSKPFFFAKKVGSQDRCSFCIVLSCIFFIVLSRIFHSCQKSDHAWTSKSRIVKLVRVLSFSLCHYHHVIRYIWPLFQYLLRSWHILIVPVTYLQVVNAFYIRSGAGFVWTSPHVCRVIRLYADHWSQLNLA